jgi:hypothetical protein
MRKLVGNRFWTQTGQLSTAIAVVSPQHEKFLFGQNRKFRFDKPWLKLEEVVVGTTQTQTLISTLSS